MSRRNSANVFGGIGSPLGRAQATKAFSGLLQLRIEVADAEPRQGRFHAIDDGDSIGRLASAPMDAVARRAAASSTEKLHP
jgi:hypothetical protein